jgi:hypothetical protein
MDPQVEAAFDAWLSSIGMTRNSPVPYGQEAYLASQWEVFLLKWGQMQGTTVVAAPQGGSVRPAGFQNTNSVRPGGFSQTPGGVVGPLQSYQPAAPLAPARNQQAPMGSPTNPFTGRGPAIGI